MDEARFVNRVRDLLVREDGETLWLAAGVPRQWLAPGQTIELRDAPTYFGPVSYRTAASASGVDARVVLPSRNPYRSAWLVVRAPGRRRIRNVEIDGKPWPEFEVAKERIHLPMTKRLMRISVHF